MSANDSAEASAAFVLVPAAAESFVDIGCVHSVVFVVAIKNVEATVGRGSTAVAL